MPGKRLSSASAVQPLLDLMHGLTNGALFVAENIVLHHESFVFAKRNGEQALHVGLVEHLSHSA